MKARQISALPVLYYAPMAAKKIFIIAGEASGDTHAAVLMRELKTLRPDLEFHGLGGKAMVAEGARLLFDLPSIAAVGLGDVLRRYPQFHKVFYHALDQVRNTIRPDLIILIDYPGFNLRFAKKINCSIPIVYYISPQVWAWGKKRIPVLARLVKKMLVFLPFEVDVYKGSGLDVEFIGHPLLEMVRPGQTREELKRKWHLSAAPVLGLFPGSREQEIKRILPIMIKTAALLKKDFPALQFILSQSPTLPQELYDRIMGSAEVKITAVRENFYDTLSITDFAMVASGTATLETAISKVPFVLLYKTGGLTYFIGRLLVKIKFLGLVNILAGRAVIPEFIQHEARPEMVAAALQELMTRPERKAAMLAGIQEALNLLGPAGAVKRAAAAIVKVLEQA